MHYAYQVYACTCLIRSHCGTYACVPGDKTLHYYERLKMAQAVFSFQLHQSTELCIYIHTLYFDELNRFKSYKYSRKLD